MGEINNAMVVILGIGTVYVGLIALVVICKLMSFCAGSVSTGNASLPKPQSGNEKAGTQTSEEEKTGLLDAVGTVAVRAALAEYLNTDVSDIRIKSISKIDEGNVPGF